LKGGTTKEGEGFASSDGRGRSHLIRFLKGGDNCLRISRWSWILTVLGTLTQKQPPKQNTKIEIRLSQKEVTIGRE